MDNTLKNTVVIVYQILTLVKSLNIMHNFKFLQRNEMEKYDCSIF